MSQTAATTNDILLQIEHLETHFITDAGTVRAVDDVSLAVRKGETLGIVGESGCGKSVTALSVLRLIPNPPGKIVGGKILLDGRNLLDLPENEMRKVRGASISMIFQEPMTSLNPVFTVGDQIAEGIRLHQRLSKRDAWNKAIEMLRLVRIPDAERRVKEYPHQMSGGMRQRVMIAMALSCNPAAPDRRRAHDGAGRDDPGADPGAAQPAQGRDGHGGHADHPRPGGGGGYGRPRGGDVRGTGGRGGAGAWSCSRIRSIPYTQGLLNSMPRIEKAERRPRLQAIPGMVPDLLDLPQGCKFQARCSKVFDACRGGEPQLKAIGSPDHFARCYLY